MQYQWLTGFFAIVNASQSSKHIVVKTLYADRQTRNACVFKSLKFSISNVPGFASKVISASGCKRNSNARHLTNGQLIPLKQAGCAAAEEYRFYRSAPNIGQLKLQVG